MYPGVETATRVNICANTNKYTIYNQNCIDRSLVRNIFVLMSECWKLEAGEELQLDKK